jgi:DNA-binding GntR family transcriptional regulator
MPKSSLPPEHELCLEFGIGRMKARRGLSMLEDAGLVYREVTRGTFVYFCDPQARGNADQTRKPMACSVSTFL